MSGAVSSYGTRHLQALFGSLGRLARAPLATMLTLMVIGVALALPAGLARCTPFRMTPSSRARRSNPAISGVMSSGSTPKNPRCTLPVLIS